MPNGLKKIGDGAFEDCSSLKSISLPENIKIIPANAFRRCKSLMSIKLPNQLRRLGTCAFHGCDGLESLTFPENMQMLDHCSVPDTLSEIHITNKNPQKAVHLYMIQFEGTVFVPIGTKKKYLEDVYWKEFDIKEEKDCL